MIYKESQDDENYFSNIIDINMKYIKEKDYKINEKNIWGIYRENLDFLNELNKESKKILERSYQSFNETFMYKFKIKNDENIKIIKDNLKVLNEIFSNKNSNYKKKVNNNLDYINKKIKENYNELNKYYLEILNKSEYYDYFSIDEKKFNDTFALYYNSLNNFFNDYLNQIDNLNNDYNFNNSFSHSMKKIFKSIIDCFEKNISEYSKNFEFKLLNLSFELDKYIIKEMMKEYDNFEFSFVYDYIKCFFNINPHKNYLKGIINELKVNILNNFKIDYNIFLNKIKSCNNYVNNNYIAQLKQNFSKCSSYSIENINDYIEQDKIDWERYKNYTELKNKIDKNELEIVTYENKTKYLLYCHENNYFNYTSIIIKDELKDDKIKNIINNIINIINSNKFNHEFLIEFLFNEFSSDINEKNKMSINDLDIDFYSEFEDFNYLCENIFLKEEQKYINKLKQIFINNFNNSYIDFIDKYLIKEINTSIFIMILEDINIKLNYIKKNIIEESEYHFALMNHTESIGISTSKALIILYPTLYTKINYTLSDIMDNIFHDLNLLFFKNKKLFQENYINHIINWRNNSFNEIYKIDKYINYIIKDSAFNKTLINISYDLLFKNILNKIENDFYSIINKNLNDLRFLLFNLSNQMNKNLELLNITNYPDDLVPIVNENNDFFNLINEQNNKFNFLVSQKPYIIIENFIYTYIKPSLIQIKYYYNEIEDQFLEQLFNIINNFDDVYGLIIKKLDKNKKTEYLNKSINLTNYLFNDYSNKISNEISDIKNKLFYFTYINGLNKNNLRNLNDINQNKFYLNESKLIIKQNNNSNYNNKNINTSNSHFRILEFNYQNGQYNLYHIVKKFRNIKNIFKTFCKNILSPEFKKIIINLDMFILKNQEYLIQLERSIDFSLNKYSTFLTEEKLSELRKKIYFQYNLIEPYIFEYLNETSKYILDFVNILNTKESFYDLLYTQLNISITNDYNELVKIIKNKYDIINFENFRHLEYAKKPEKNELEFTISLRFNVVDLLPKLFNPRYVARNFILKDSPLKVNCGLEIFLGFGIEFGIEKKKDSFDISINLYAEVSKTLFFEIGIFEEYKGCELNFAAGISVSLSYIRIGIKYEYTNESNKENTNVIKIYGESKDQEFKIYIYFEFLFLKAFSTRVELAHELYTKNESKLFDDIILYSNPLISKD